MSRYQYSQPCLHTLFTSMCSCIKTSFNLCFETGTNEAFVLLVFVRERQRETCNGGGKSLFETCEALTLEFHFGCYKWIKNTPVGLDVCNGLCVFLEMVLGFVLAPLERERQTDRR